MRTVLSGAALCALFALPLHVSAQSIQATGSATNDALSPVCAAGVTTCTWLSPDGLSSSHGAGYATAGGPMGVVATVTANGLTSGGQFASGLAVFTDVFTLSNVPPGGTVQFSVYLTGSASLPANSCYSTATQRGGVVLTPPTSFGPSPCPVQARSNLYFWLDYNYAPTDPLLNTTGASVYDFIPQPLNSNYTNVSGVYDGLYSVTVPVVAGTVPIRFLMLANAGLLFPSPGGFTGTVSSDFFSTARINSILFFDANGVDVSDQVGFSAASGALYPIGLPTDDPNVVPEPGTMALLATGLALLGGAARRRVCSEEPLG